MTHQTRRGTPLECPLASLGRSSNTPSSALDHHQAYHHPLSSSPLNPEIYQMSRKSPIVTDDIIYTSSSSGQYQENRHNSNSINESSGMEMYNLSRSSSSSMEQSANRSQQHPQQQNQHQFQLKRNLMEPIRRRPFPSRQFTPIDDLLQCRTNRSCNYMVQNATSNDNSNKNPNNNTTTNGNGRRSVPLPNSSYGNLNQRIDKLECGVERDHQQYYLEQKMDALYLQGAIRGLPLGSEVNHFQNEQYYLDENLTRFCDYNNESSGCDRMHDNIHDSETSGSERYLIERPRGSPAFVNQQSPMLSTKNGISEFTNQTNSSSSQLEKRFHPTKVKSLSEGLSNIGRFSPSLDQGYATLVSPSPTTSGHQIPAPWNKKNITRSGSGFDRLPDDVIIKIFSWFNNSELCNVAKVCRRFENLAWRPILWKFIVLKGEQINGDRALKMIFRRLCGQSRNGACPDVERVMMSEACRISDKGLQLLTRRCPELTHLQLQSSAISNKALSDVLTKCNNLQHLDVTGCTVITSISMNSNLEPPRRLLLQYLDLTDCTAIDDIGLKIVVRNCPQLVFLYLRRCVQITDSGLKFVPSFCITLKELSVSDCVNITDFGLYELAKLGAALRYLSVAKCDRVSDAGLKVIARRCYKLRYLNCRGLEAVSDDSITFLARSCPRLRALDIGKCDVSDAGLRAIAESCPNLKKLSLRNCDMITDRGIQCIAYYCRGLQQLNIQDCQISIEGYRAVKKYCKRCIIEHTNPGFY